MIRVTYYSKGYATILVRYPSDHNACKACGNEDGYFLAFRNGATLHDNQYSHEYSQRRRVAIFDVDTVYDSDLDDKYYCQTPEAECALEIAREALR